MDRTYEEDEPRYEKGDRVWVLRGGAAREPGVVIGHHVDWNLYRVVYTVDLADQGPRAVEEWRLSFRRKGEEHWQAETPASDTPDTHTESLTSEGISGPSVLTRRRSRRADKRP